jgi:hypothetical protein
MNLKENVDQLVRRDKLLNKPFNIYSSQVRLSYEEKLNIIERELIQVYKNKTKRK